MSYTEGYKSVQQKNWGKGMTAFTTNHLKCFITTLQTVPRHKIVHLLPMIKVVTESSDDAITEMDAIAARGGANAVLGVQMFAIESYKYVIGSPAIICEEETPAPCERAIDLG